MKKMVIRALCFVPCALCLLLGAGAADLPAGYTQVEYIESTNGGGQYIDTEYIHKDNTRVECSVNVASEQEQGYPVIFGSYNGSYQSNAFAFFAKFFPEKYGENTPPALGRTGCEQEGEPNSFPYDTRVDLVCEGKQASWSRFGETSVCGSINNTEATVDDGVWPMNIFVNNNNGAQSGNTWCAMRLYSFQIYEGNALKRDFVPCIETSSGRAGLWDKVEGKFYGNAGSGAFLAGPPSGYTAVEYIESTRGGGQYINTGYTPNKNTKVVCRILDTGTDTSKEFGSIFGSRKGWSRERSMYFWLRRYGSTVPCYGRAGAEGWKDDKATFPFGDITAVTCQGRTCSWVNDDGTKNGSIGLADDYVDSQENGFAPLVIFALNSSDAEGGCYPTDHWGFRLYSFRIYEGAALKRDFVPCVSPSEGAGLWDKVEGKFYENKGSSAFGFSGTAYHDPISGETKVADAIEVTGSTSTLEDGKWYVVKGNVSRGTITVNGSANLILADGAKLTVNGGENQAGIEVTAGNVLRIWGQVHGTGELIANGVGGARVLVGRIRTS